ncbi:hypothetical protein HDU99_001375, partial [Rhizoclosmatium hyalinum]
MCMIILYARIEYFKPSASVLVPVPAPLKEHEVPRPPPPQYDLDDAKEECFRSQPSTCFFDFKWRPIPQVLIQKRSRHPRTNQWLPVKRPYSNHTRKLQLLYYCHQEHYRTSMDRFLYDEIDSAVTHPGINVSFWGPAFPGWNDHKSVIENINFHFQNVTFDIIYSMDHWQSQFPTTAVAISTI